MQAMKWGIISTAKIGREQVIPAMQQADLCDMTALASRDKASADQVAATLGIPTTYGSYESLLADPAIEAVYNPLPNHLHVPLTIEAAKAGKHVLCEKPIALTAEEARSLIEVRNETGVHIEEAFMIHHHPQWQCVVDMVGSGEIGELRSVNTVFSYFNDDPDNVRNMADIGGGGLYDIGCYGIIAARKLYGSEPVRAIGLLNRDPRYKTDRVASCLLDFADGQASVTVSTQMVPFQQVQVLGTKGRIELEIPFNPPPDGAARVYIDEGAEKAGASRREISAEVVNHYTRQGDAFVLAARGEAEPAMTLEASVANMRVIDAVFASAESNRWVDV